MHSHPALPLLKQLEPFSLLDEKQLRQFSEALDVVYFPLGSTFDNRMNLSETENASFYFVIKGRIAEYDDEGRQTALYLSNSFFGESVLLNKAGGAHYQVKEEAIVYRLAASNFLEWVQKPLLNNYFFDSITAKFDQLHKTRQIAASSEALMGLVLEANIQSLVTVDHNDKLQTAVEKMAAFGCDSCLVKIGNGHETVEDFGMLTAMDVLHAVAHSDKVMQTPVESLIKVPIVSVHQHDYLFNALLKMTRHRINRLVVRDDQKPIGILHQKDLMAHFAAQSGLSVLNIEQVSSVQEIPALLEHVDTLVVSLNERGVKTHYIAKMATEIYRKVFQKVFALLSPTKTLQQGCLVVMGSEGRAEQVMRTDQDNAFILPEGMDHQDANLVKFSEEFSRTLVSMGFPKCPGDVMVCNPLWFQTVTAFRAQLKSWMSHPDENAFMNLSIFLDAEAVAGDGNLLKELKQNVFDWVKNYPQFLRHFAKPVFQFDTPINFFGQLVAEKSDSESLMDLKKGGIFPVVHGIRCLALEYDIEQTNTHWRIKKLMDRGFFSEDFGYELGESLNFFNTLRLENMIALRQNGVSDEMFAKRQNKIQVTELTRAQQDLLKDAFDVVKRFKRQLNHHYRLDTVF